MIDYDYDSRVITKLQYFTIQVTAAELKIGLAFLLLSNDNIIRELRHKFYQINSSEE